MSMYPVAAARPRSPPDDKRLLVVQVCGDSVNEDSTNMLPRATRTGRRALQALGFVLATAYATILLYQAVVPPTANSPQLQQQQWLEVQEAETSAPIDVPIPLLRLFATRTNNNNNVVNSRALVALQQPAVVLQDDVTGATPSYATATMAPFSTDLDDLFISVKTSKHYHHTRLPDVIDTWFQHAKKQTWFFTDRDDPYFQNQTNGHMINTKCSSSHHRRALCCKMSVEFDRYLESGKKWFCHFDDDNYVNVPRLVKLLDNYNPREDWYLGKPSIPHALEVYLQNSFINKKQKIGFWFATGGAGFCISRALALKMIPVAGGGKFITVGDRIRLPDDVTMGYIIEHLLKKKLTVVEQFHSHLEALKFLNKDTLHEQISFSYSKGLRDEWNVVKVDGYSTKDDPRRFKSLHCHLFPNATHCPHR